MDELPSWWKSDKPWIIADCLEVMKGMPDNSVDSIVTDPPYELGFMGKAWDNTGIAYNVEMWKQALRVLKPGGHLLAFGGSRTYHRMACAIEDAGFEVRDMIEWMYGSGFPKSLNIGKAVDKIAGETGRKEKFTEWMRTTGITTGEINKITNSFMGSHYLTTKEQPAIPTSAIWAILRPHIKTEIPKWVDELVERIEREREVVGKSDNGIAGGSGEFTQGNPKSAGFKAEFDITKGTSEYEGWGTALKPAHEPICMARKPLSEKTVAENVLKWGTGGINIGGCRVEATQEYLDGKGNAAQKKQGDVYGWANYDKLHVRGEPNTQGRFPANLIHDGSDEVLACFPDTQTSFRKNGSVVTGETGSPFDNTSRGSIPYSDCGSAARFFYCAKASKAERNAGCEGNNNHPTVKPIALIEYLIKLVTPKNGIVFDPFLGSGTTIKAAHNPNLIGIGSEITKEYEPIIAKRSMQNIAKLDYFLDTHQPQAEAVTGTGHNKRTSGSPAGSTQTSAEASHDHIPVFNNEVNRQESG